MPHAVPMVVAIAVAASNIYVPWTSNLALWATVSLAAGAVALAILQSMRHYSRESRRVPTISALEDGDGERGE